jgi:hypothetical protein
VSLALASAVLHGAACVLCLVYAYARRCSAERQRAYVLAIVWCGGFALALLHGWFVAALPPPGPEPFFDLKNRTLLALDGAAYFASPLGILAWIRWAFIRSRPWPIALAWVALSLVPVAVYPALVGRAWFRYAGAIHVAALAGEIAAIASWARLRELPRPWHSIAIVATPLCAFPAIPFFASTNEAREGYLLWVLRGLVCLHLWCLAVLGGDLWNQRSRGSSRSS